MTDQVNQLLQKWEADMRYGTRKQRVERAKRWIPYYTYLCEQEAEQPFDPTAAPEGFLSVMEENGMIRRGDSVLDIGAGAGAYALRLAKRCRFVTALEVNPAGIAVMQRRAAKFGVSNLETVASFWETYEPDRQFDVVFTSMCPVICNREEIEKMERISRRTCCILTVLPGSFDLHRRQMMQKLGLHPDGMITNGERYEKILTAMGRNVSVFTRETSARRTVSFSEALERYTVYFQIFGISPEETESFLQAYFAQNAEDGVLQDESHMRYALLTWNTNTSSN